MSASSGSEVDIEHKINNGKRIISSINSTLWSKEIRLETKKKIYHSFVESVATYGSEVWTLTKKMENKLLSMEMDFWRRSCGISRIERIPNAAIRDKVGCQKNILHLIGTKRLKWYGHLMRMDENRWPKKIYNYMPPERRKRGRPKKKWTEDVEESMAARGLREGDWMDREQWLLGVGDMTP